MWKGKWMEPKDLASPLSAPSLAPFLDTHCFCGLHSRGLPCSLLAGSRARGVCSVERRVQMRDDDDGKGVTLVWGGQGTSLDQGHSQLLPLSFTTISASRSLTMSLQSIVSM